MALQGAQSHFHDFRSAGVRFLVAHHRKFFATAASVCITCDNWSRLMVTVREMPPHLYTRWLSQLRSDLYRMRFVMFGTGPFAAPTWFRALYDTSTLGCRGAGNDSAWRASLRGKVVSRSGTLRCATKPLGVGTPVIDPDDVNADASRAIAAGGTWMLICSSWPIMGRFCRPKRSAWHAYDTGRSICIGFAIAQVMP